MEKTRLICGQDPLKHGLKLQYPPPDIIFDSPIVFSLKNPLKIGTRYFPEAQDAEDHSFFGTALLLLTLFFWPLLLLKEMCFDLFLLFQVIQNHSILYSLSI